MESKFSVYTSVFNAWVVGVNLASALLTRLEALATRRFQRLSFYTVHFTAVLTRRSYIEEAGTSGGILLFIAVSFFLIFSLTKHRSSSNDVTGIL